MREKLHNLVYRYREYLAYVAPDKLVFSLYRLQNILRDNMIECFSDIIKSGKPTFNGGKRIGSYNSDDEICFAMRNHDFHENLSSEYGSRSPFACDTGGAYFNFISHSISVMLAYDDTFKSYDVSNESDSKYDDNYVVFRDEIRIKGSIKKPNIVAIGIPMINDMDGSLVVRKIFEFYRELIRLIRYMLDLYNYHDVMIVDNKEGYNLESPIVMNAIEKSLSNKDSYKYDYRWRDQYGFIYARKSIEDTLLAEQDKQFY